MRNKANTHDLRRGFLLLHHDDGSTEYVPGKLQSDLIVEMREGRGPRRMEWIQKIVDKPGSFDRLEGEQAWLEGETAMERQFRLVNQGREE